MGNNSPCRSEFEAQLDHAKQVDIRVVDSEIQGNKSGAPTYPKAFFEFPQNELGLISVLS